MSDEGESPDVELVRRSIELYIAGDQDSAWALWDEDSVGVPPREWPEPGPFRGRQAIREVFDSWETAFGVGWQGSMAIDRLVELDGGRILVELSFHPTGTASGVSLDQAVASIYTVRGDRVVHAEFFMSHEAARAAAGLE